LVNFSCELVAVGPTFAADMERQPNAMHQSGSGTTPAVSRGETQSPLGMQRSSGMIGNRVVNSKGENLGKIDDLIIDKKGTLKYAILSHGGLLGIGDKLVPVPWKALKPGEESGTVVMNIDKKTLEKAPSFEAKEWPNFSEPEWQKKVEVYYELPSQAQVEVK
jgi:sporulation protein YlmC with PRC-barrel domain